VCGDLCYKLLLTYFSSIGESFGASRRNEGGLQNLRANCRCCNNMRHTKTRITLLSTTLPASVASATRLKAVCVYTELMQFCRILMHALYTVTTGCALSSHSAEKMACCASFTMDCTAIQALTCAFFHGLTTLAQCGHAADPTIVVTFWTMPWITSL
jgi:hypothetical protein